MASLRELLQTADWKSEKHVPVIDAPLKAKKGEVLSISLTVGKEIPHPNTTEHHIRWIGLFFHPKGEKFPYQVAKFDFASHGESVQGPNTSTIYAEPRLTCAFKTEKAGNLIATSYCNIHGLWESSKELNIE